jgi:hypothetical protein
VAHEVLDSRRQQCTLSPSTSHSWVSRQPQHVIASAPPYSPDLAPVDFFLFPKMKMQLKGHRIHTVAEIQCESQTTTRTWS